MIRYLKDKVRGFWRSRRGNVAITFAIIVLPMCLIVGAAMDYNRAVSDRTAMQDAVDASALAISRMSGLPSMTTQQLQTTATAYFNANFQKPADNVTITANYNSTAHTLTLTATGAAPTTFLQLAQMSSIPINASSTTTWGSTRLRVALVLDNTGSMSANNKMSALQSATNNLLTQLQGVVSTSGDVYVSIIPFSDDVNVGANNTAAGWDYTANWIDWTTWDASNGSNVVTGGTCSKSRYTSKSNCQNNNGTWTNTYTWTPDAHSTWNGCVTDRGVNGPPPATASGDPDTTNAAPTSGSTLFPADQSSSCDVQLVPLTAIPPGNGSMSTLTTAVNAMTPNGSTNQTIGLQWGFQSLTAAPFNIPAQTTGYTYQNILIILSDGLNTQNRFIGNGQPNQPQATIDQIDAREALVCQHIKDAGITVYAIQVDTATPADPQSVPLSSCASDPSKFFFVTSSGSIGTVFNQIGSQLSKLRISH